MCEVIRARDSKENLCDTCIYDFGGCDADEGLMEFGDGSGSDNVIACNAHEHE